MKVAMLAPEFLPVWGGVGTYIVELTKNLPKDVEIHVLTPRRYGLGREKASSDDYDFDEIFSDNVHVHFISTASDTFVYNAKFQYACFKYVPKLIKEEGIDIVHSHAAHMPDILLQFRKLDIPTVTTIHTTIKGQREGAKASGASFFKLEASEKSTYITYPFLRLAEKVYFSKKRDYITPSNWMRNQILEDGDIDSSNITTIHNGVDPRVFSPKNKRYVYGHFPQFQDIDQPIVLYSSRLTSTKGAHFLVKAIPKILEKEDVHFLFAGGGRGEFNVPIPKENYTYLGYVDYRKMPYLYAASTIFLVTTLYENFPIRILEAMASELPVVSTSVCAIPEAIEHGKNGLLMPPKDVNAITDNIVHLLENVDESKRLARNARKTVLENFTWSKSAKKTKEFYEKVLEAA